MKNKYFFAVLVFSLFEMNAIICQVVPKQQPVPSEKVTTKGKKPQTSQKPKPSPKKEQFSLVGTWSGVIEGDRLVWRVYADGTEEYAWYHSEFIQRNEGIWRLDSDILFEDWKNHNSDVCKIKFISQNHLVLTVLENGNPNNRNQQRHYYRVNNP